ncbi:hypothetical protein DPEC_G00246340 [Dallia pectoralis]|uniref:Uncharacterized protein n=1 Tax=Dallia pectoralis TaxID=75939 RepID=A0ACC2FW96_DALPE|nr:hypothetical protein DPEC_G00246340 [Dallia pectoralis]
MRCTGLVILGFLLNKSHCSDKLVEDMEIEQKVTGVLGENVYFRCQYLGMANITDASWKRKGRSLRKLTGYRNNQPFRYDPDFSYPTSLTNLTVRLNVSRLDAQGEYTCAFATDEDEITDILFLTVLARPVIHTVVTHDIDNSTHYQSVTCSAGNSKPAAVIGWEINGNPLLDESFTVAFSNSSNINGTGTVTSTLRFPTHLQDQDLVTCVVQHPSLPDNITQVSVMVETFMAPNISIETDLVQKNGTDFWVITCAATGGRPEANITLVLSDQKVIMDTPGTWSYHLPTEFHQGENISCQFDHPKFPHSERRTVTLPTFYLSGVRLLNPGLADSLDQSRTVESVVLKEGQSKTRIDLAVVGSVPRYNIECSIEERALPEGVLVTGSALTLEGPVELHHAGLYECRASYYNHTASILLDIIITPHLKQTVAVRPSMRIDVQDRLGDRFIECLAAVSVPGANVSWVLPEGVFGPSWSNHTSNNGNHSVSSVVVLPACSAHKLQIECVIDHSLFVLPERMQISLPACAPPNITLQSSFEWVEDTAYTLVQCTVDSVRPAANISWCLGDRNIDPHNSTSQIVELQEQTRIHANGSLTTHSVVKFPTAMLASQNVTCVVDHQGLERPERRGIQLPRLESPSMRAFVVRQKFSPLWLAVCEYQGDGMEAHLSWVLPDNTTAQISPRSEYKGMKVLTNLTYEFPLALREGQDLTCLIQNRHGLKERRTVNVPKYYITSVRVLNQTTPLNRDNGHDPVIHRLALKESLHDQKILLKVYGSVPTYNLTCYRSDGSLIQMEGTALVFQAEEWEAGRYICLASFYHHQSSVHIQVEVTSKDKQLMTIIIICFSSAAAIMIILVACLCVFCKINGEVRPKSKKRESLATLTPLTQEPCSPEMRKGNAAAKEVDGEGYAHLLSYSIVIDVRSTV